MSEQNVWVVKAHDYYCSAFEEHYEIFGIFTCREEALDAAEKVNFGCEVSVSLLPLNKADIQPSEIDEILREWIIE